MRKIIEKIRNMCMFISDDFEIDLTEQDIYIDLNYGKD